MLLHPRIQFFKKVFPTESANVECVKIECILVYYGTIVQKGKGKAFKMISS